MSTSFDLSKEFIVEAQQCSEHQEQHHPLPPKTKLRHDVAAKSMPFAREKPMAEAKATLLDMSLRALRWSPKR